MSETSSRPKKDDCPRMIESGRTQPLFEYLNKPDDGDCDYCGSLLGDYLMARLEKGDVVLGPTDKVYKCYASNQGGEQFRESYRTDDKEPRRVRAAGNARLLLENKDVAPDSMSGHDLDDARRYLAGQELDWTDQRHWQWTTRLTDDAKFYFQHLTSEQRERFVELFNQGKLHVGPPGYFYRLPFFMKIMKPQAPSQPEE